jgi:Protein of unknown function (DUF4242)
VGGGGQVVGQVAEVVFGAAEQFLVGDIDQRCGHLPQGLVGSRAETLDEGLDAGFAVISGRARRRSVGVQHGCYLAVRGESGGGFRLPFPAYRPGPNFPPNSLNRTPSEVESRFSLAKAASGGILAGVPNPSLEQPRNTGNTAMPKFLSSHTLPAGAVSREQVNRMAQAAQDDPIVRPYRSFLNLSEGRIVCVLDAPDKDTLAAWFARMNLPCDYISRLELEGEGGTVSEV